MKITIKEIHSVSEAFLMADDYIIDRSAVTDCQCHPDRSFSIYVNDIEYVFEDREHTNAIWDWMHPDRVEDVGLTPRWYKYVGQVR